MSVIRAKSYDENEAALTRDPIISDMAIDITRMVARGDEVNLFDHTFMMASLREYTSRGGQLAEHIGGPSAAIRAVMIQTADSLDSYVAFYSDVEHRITYAPNVDDAELADLTERAAKIRRAATIDPRSAE